MKTHHTIRIVVVIVFAMGAHLGCALFGGSSGGSSEPTAEKPVTIELYSYLEVPICEVYAHYEGTDEVEGGWGENRLESGAQLAPEGMITFEAPRIDGDSYLDIMAMDCDGKMHYRRYDAKVPGPGINEIEMYEPQDPGPTYIASDSGSDNEVSVYIKNACSSDQNFCYTNPGGMPYQSVMGVSNSMSFDMEVGAEIALSDGSTCGSVVHTVTADDDGEEVVICE